MTEPSLLSHKVEQFALGRLGDFGAGQDRLVFVLDPECRLRWQEDASASVTDVVGRNWRVLSYRGNDMSLRARFVLGQRTAVWVRPAPMERPDSIDLTTLADLVSLADAFVDASLAGILQHLLPDIPLPSEISEWAPDAADDAQAFAAALRCVLNFRGKPISKRHVLAAAAVQASPKVTPEAAWLDDSDFPSLVVSYCRLVSADPSRSLRESAGKAFLHVASLLTAASAEVKALDAARMIARFPAEVVNEFLYLLAAARRHGLPDPVGALANRGLLSSDIASAIAQLFGFRELLTKAADSLNLDGGALESLAQDVERRIDATVLRKVQGLLGDKANYWQTEPTSAVRLLLMASVCDAVADGLRTASFKERIDAPVGARKFVRACEATNRVGIALSRYSDLADHLPIAESLDIGGLVDAYVSGLATAEYDLEEASRDLASLKSMLGEQKKLSTFLNSTLIRCREFNQACDACLAKLLHANPSVALSRSESIHRWLPETVSPRLHLHPDNRVWLLVFDGMRWDLWERVLRPELENAGWDVSTGVGLALLPTETGLCRLALLAGKLPLASTSGTQSSEEALVRDFFQKDAGSSLELRYRLRAEESGGDVQQAGLGQINVLVFSTPDHQSHQVGVTLRDVAIQFRGYLRENVMPELREQVSPEDLVFVAADHGFVRVTGDNPHVVSIAPDRVHDRFITLQSGDTSAGPCLQVSHPGIGNWWVATEELVFIPVGAPSGGTRFRHGGATLAEMVVPLSEIRVRVEATGTLAIEIVGPTDLQEDVVSEFTGRIMNGSADDVRGQLLLETNLAVVRRLPVHLAAGGKVEVKCSVLAQEGVAWVRARIVSGTVTLASKTVSLTVRLKPGIKLEGLDGLDDDL